VAVFAFTMAILPAAGPPLAVLALGEHARPGLERLNRAVTEHRREFTIALCVVFGLGLSAVGLAQLL
jgi:hypothetical protein